MFDELPVKVRRGFGYKEHLKKIVCSDGTMLSVQASEYHYCSPRAMRGPYVLVEVGYPTASPPDSWADYFGGDWDDVLSRLCSVYGYVPIELVVEFINDHGGILRENFQNHHARNAQKAALVTNYIKRRKRQGISHDAAKAEAHDLFGIKSTFKRRTK